MFGPPSGDLSAWMETQIIIIENTSSLSLYPKTRATYLFGPPSCDLSAWQRWKPNRGKLEKDFQDDSFSWRLLVSCQKLLLFCLSFSLNMTIQARVNKPEVVSFWCRRTRDW